jgi:acetyl-CoA acetyltransferase
MDSIASGYMDICAACGFEAMSHVNTWKGNEFIPLASDVSYDQVDDEVSGFPGLCRARLWFSPRPDRAGMR